MQAQMRDLSGFVETRQKLLTLKPNQRMNWIGFTVAHHLNSKYVSALFHYLESVWCCWYGIMQSNLLILQLRVSICFVCLLQACSFKRSDVLCKMGNNM